MKTKTKMRLMQGGGIVTAFTPLAIEIAVNRDMYFATKEAGWSMTIGAIIAIFLVSLAMLGKLGRLFGNEIMVVGTIFVMSCLLKPILLNFQYISGLLLAGMIVNKIVFQTNINKLKKRIEYEEQAQAVKEALKNG
jgi:uncharacterized membrane protein YciS (DUF1049 family)